jgi:hypothetical protein
MNNNRHPQMPTPSNRFERAIIEARAHMDMKNAELAEMADTEFAALQRLMTECAMEFVKSPDEAPDPELLLQRVKRIKADCRNMYLMLELIHTECVEGGAREISRETWQKLCNLLGKVA